MALEPEQRAVNTHEANAAPRGQRSLPFLRAFRRQPCHIDVTKDTQFSDAWVLLAILLLDFGLIVSNRFFTTAGILLLTLASGDSPRRIHWKATARHQALLSRVYEPSKEQQVLIFLNVATLERHWFGTIPELQERTISVAASLAALASEQRLPVGLIANGTLPGSDQPLRLLPGRNPEQLTRILELLAAVTPFASDPIEQLLLKETPRLGWGATVVVVTAIAAVGGA
jgi:hypothetical protein